MVTRRIMWTFSLLFHGLDRLGHILIKITFAVVLALVTAVVTFGAFFFATPEIVVNSERIEWLVDRFAPRNLEISFAEGTIRLLRPQGLPWTSFAKQIEVDAKDFCVRYEDQAVNSCFETVDLGAAIGWGGKSDAPWYMPRLRSIDPVILQSGVTEIDLAQMPEKEEPEDDAGGVDAIELLRTEILPKWRIEGSQIEMDEFVFKNREGGGYAGRFDLLTLEDGDTVRATLHELKALTGPMSAKGVITLKRPESWGRGRSEVSDPGKLEPWILDSEGRVALDKKRSVEFNADARIRTWDDLDLNLLANVEGIGGIEEAGFDGTFKQSQLDGHLGLVMAWKGGPIRDLSLKECPIDFNFKDSSAWSGHLVCGSEQLALRFPDIDFLKQAGLYTLHPRAELTINRFNFSGDKLLDFNLNLEADDREFLKLKLAGGGVVGPNPEGEGVKYDIDAALDTNVTRFQGLVRLLRGSLYAIPAPINVLDGNVDVNARFIGSNDKPGQLRVGVATRLDSQYQAAYLNLQSDTRWQQLGKGFRPITDATLLIDRLNVSAPKFELRAPPRFFPDSRFRTIDDPQNPSGESPSLAAGKAGEQAEESGAGLRFKMRTTNPQAIKIATNLTGNAIPVDLNLTYSTTDEQIDLPQPEEEPGTGPKLLASREPASLLGANIKVISEEETAIEQGRPLPSRKPSEPVPAKLTGIVSIGRTPIELFRREAVVDKIDVEFKKSGARRINGKIDVNYLDYQINMLLAGRLTDPQIRFTSSPPLEDDQIIAVLLFGRPLNELGDDQKASVSSLDAAVTDAALGLSSLYVLANTPVESVGYDAENQVVTAKIGIGGGASIELGSSGSTVATVGLQKRLGKNVTFRSEVERLESTGRRTVTAFVEWVRRF